MLKQYSHNPILLFVIFSGFLYTVVCLVLISSLFE